MGKFAAFLLAVVNLVQEILRRVDDWAEHRDQEQRRERNDEIQDDPGGAFADRFGRRVPPPSETSDVPGDRADDERAGD